MIGVPYSHHRCYMLMQSVSPVCETETFIVCGVMWAMLAAPLSQATMNASMWRRASEKIIWC